MPTLHLQVKKVIEQILNKISSILFYFMFVAKSSYIIGI